MPWKELAEGGVVAVFAGILLWAFMKSYFQSLRDLAKQHKEIIEMGCHNQDIQKEHKEAMKEIVTSLKSINGK